MKPKWICFFIGHKWSMYRGFEEIKPHHTARCLRCDAKPRQV